ncbi:hypothetical protein A21D_03990 [Virgibacillus dokdonensis]|uniref:Uncharacterized protein n=2 Tax=Virgibacillus dokdonensis TaxID=302167 RepID=A0A2K9J5K3_9BACI|nr:hypothetical protein A21D_03990 [Virgibacillus dokdonensis]
MKKAYFAKGDCFITVEEALDKQIREALFCASENCRIPVTPRRSHFREINHKKKVIPSHFMIKGKRDHDSDCCYNTEGQLKIIAKDSEDALSSTDNQKFLLRLNLITSEMKKDKDSSSKDVQSSSKKPSTKTYENKGKLNSYLSTMSKIMKLQSEVENNQELNQLIKLDVGRKQVRWSQFFYNEDRHRQCYNYVHTNSIHPVCICGEISSIELNKKFNCYSLKLKKRKLNEVSNDEDGIKRVPSILVNVYNESVAKHIKYKNEVEQLKNISFFSFIKTSSKPYLKDVLYLNMYGFVHHSKQIYVF